MRNKLKKIMIFLLTIATATMICINSVYAEEVANSLTMKSTSISGSETPVKFPTTFKVKKTVNGKYVYCTDYAKKTPSSGIKYTKGKLVTDNGINYILKQAINNVKDDDGFFIYQTSLWIYLDNKGLQKQYATINTFEKTVNNSNSTAAKKIKNIVENAKKASKNDTSAPTINFSTNNVTFSLDSTGKNYVSSKIKINSSTSDYKVTFSNAPSGTTYKIKNNYLYVYVPANKVTTLKTTFKVNISNSKNIYQSYYYNPNNSKYQIMTSTYKTTKKASASMSMTITKTTSIKVNKVDSTTNKAVNGAKLQITNSKGNIIDSWTTDSNTHTVKKLSEGTYTLSEVAAPNGYNLNNNSIKFTVDAKGVIKDANNKNITTLILTNVPSLKVTKVDAETNKELSGAKLQITNSKGKVIDSWTTNGKAHTVTSLVAGNYTLSEISAPSGYKLSTETIKFTVDASGNMKDANDNNIATLTIKNSQNNISISKKDITTSQEIAGAHLVVKNANGNIVDEWISTTEVHKISGITSGTYTLTETIAPEGYILSTETIKFTVDKYGNLTDSKGEKISKIVMYNKKIDDKYTSISKQDITTKEEIAGANLVIKDANGNIIDEWVSTTEVHKIKNLKSGTYTLTETIAPEGYELSTETIKFTINSNGNLTNESGEKISKVIMYNKKIIKTDVEISKQDITTKEEVAGAHLVVKNTNGNIVDEWISTTETHKIQNLEAGTYTLTETIAPEGYILSTETIKFIIADDGSLKNSNGTNIDKIIMYNTPIPKTGRVTISKQDSTTYEMLKGATLIVKNSKGEIIDEWISTTETHTLENLAIDTYTLTETIAPEGYILNSEAITFIVNKEGKIVNTEEKELSNIVIYNEKQNQPTKASISKQDITTKEEIAGAHLVVKDVNGNIIDEWISTTTPHLIENLELGTYTLTETIAPEGYILSNEIITFTVTDEETITKVVMYNEKEETPEIPTETIIPGKEIEVENTSSTKSIISSLIGIVSVIFGTKVIKKKFQ